MLCEEDQTSIPISLGMLHKITDGNKINNSFLSFRKHKFQGIERVCRNAKRGKGRMKTETHNGIGYF
jgi:hypothetical protein